MLLIEIRWRVWCNQQGDVSLRNSLSNRVWSSVVFQCEQTQEVVSDCEHQMKRDWQISTVEKVRSHQQFQSLLRYNGKFGDFRRGVGITGFVSEVRTDSREDLGEKQISAVERELFVSYFRTDTRKANDVGLVLGILSWNEAIHWTKVNTECTNQVHWASLWSFERSERDHVWYKIHAHPQKLTSRTYPWEFPDWNQLHSCRASSLFLLSNAFGQGTQVDRCKYFTRFS